MLLVGHACWGFVTGRIASRGLGVQSNAYLMMLFGVLPDLDLILGIFGIQHRTITHSVIFWGLIFLPVIVRYRATAIPYCIAVMQHILLGDLVVGRTSIFWPFDEPRLGLGLDILSPVNLALEGAGVALFMVIFLRDKGKWTFQSRFSALVVIAVLSSFSLLAAVGDSIAPWVSEGSNARHLERNLPSLLQSPYLAIAVGLHFLIVAFVSIILMKNPPAKLGARQA